MSLAFVENQRFGRWEIKLRDVGMKRQEISHDGSKIQTGSTMVYHLWLTQVERLESVVLMTGLSSECGMC